MVKINLDISLCEKLRNKVNEHHNILFSNLHSINKESPKYDWQKLCAIMDRLKDCTLYLNTINIKNTDQLSIFSFYDFMNVATTILDCIKYLAQIFKYDLSKENKKSTIFKKTGKTGQGNDLKYFNYLRSLCSVHPIETSRHPEYQDSTEYSPFVCWNEGICSKQYDLVAIVYKTTKGRKKNIGIKISQIFKFVSYRHKLLQHITNNIDIFCQNTLSNYRNDQLQSQDSFLSYTKYLDYLKLVYKERIGFCGDEYFNLCKKIINCKFSYHSNQEKLLKFQKALKYGLGFLQKFLQELPEGDKYETTGLKTQPPSTEGDSLFFELQSCNIGDYSLAHPIAFEKLSTSKVEQHYLNMAKDLLFEIQDIWKPYLQFEEGMNSRQLPVFLHVAIYFWRLDNDEWFKEQIPTEFK